MYNDKKKQLLIDSLRKTLGNITSACSRAGVSRGTFYTWLKEDEEFATEFEVIRNEERKDYLENALYKRCNAGDTTAIIFALKTQCKDRGWVERTELTGTDGKAIGIKQERDLTPQEAAAFIKELRETL